MVRRTRRQRAVGRADPPSARVGRDGGLHAGQSHGPAAGDAREPRSPAGSRARRRRGPPRADRVARVGHPGTGRHRHGAGQEPRTRAALHDHRLHVAERPEARLWGAGAGDPVAADRTGRVSRPREFLSRRRPLPARQQAQHGGCRARLRGLARRRSARRGPPALDASRQAAGGRRLDRAPERQPADGLRDAARGSDGGLDAVAGGHVVAQSAVPDGRGLRLPAADRQPAEQDAAPHAPQAGPRLRPRHRACHPESGRPRLQGAVERRHVVSWPVADGPRQGPRA